MKSQNIPSISTSCRHPDKWCR